MYQTGEEPNRVEELDRRCETYNKLGNFAAAAVDGLELIRLCPQAHAGYMRVGEALRGARRYEEALQYLRHGAELAPKSLQLRLLIRAVETDLHIQKKTSVKGVPPPTESFDVPPLTKATGSTLPSDDSAKPSTTMPVPRQEKEPKREQDVGAHESPLRQSLPNHRKTPWFASKRNSLIVVLLTSTLIATFLLPSYIALPIAALCVWYAHRHDATAPHVPPLGVPLCVWTSAVLCFAITWASPLLSMYLLSWSADDDVPPIDVPLAEV